MTPASEREVTIEVALPQYEKGTLAPERFDQLVMNAMEILVETGTALVATAIKPRTPWATGNLANSIMADRPIVTAFHEVIGEVGTPVKYALPVEMGTPPHEVPLYDLYMWARRKYGVPVKNAWAIAKAVQMRIAVHGTKPHHMFELGLEDAMPGLNSLISNVGDALVSRIASEQ
jgi:hypothetical protein